MITLTLHDKDAVNLLAMLRTIKKVGVVEETESFDRVAAQLKCGLLLCDCGRAATPIKSEDCRAEAD